MKQPPRVIITMVGNTYFAAFEKMRYAGSFQGRSPMEAKQRALDWWERRPVKKGSKP